MSSPRAAAIDIGSNSIKVLVAESTVAGGLTILLSQTIEARISAGINRSNPVLSADAMSRGVDAIGELLARSAVHQAAHIQLVATSAVRDAENGPAFGQQVYAATGHRIRILSGAEEAHYIGQGIAHDPALDDIQDFYLFDLGGGSLETLAFRQRQVSRIHSLQLGCVRLTERFVADRNGPITPALSDQVIRHTVGTIRDAGFIFDLPKSAPVIGTGGTLASVRSVLAARSGHRAEHGSALLAVPDLRALQSELAQMTLAERRNVPGLSPARADVFPVALATLIGVADFGGFASYRHSFCNLRHGLVAEMLAV
jgi:exopolyphosphatase/guanosine-5'-triphosphate,3'-diphosphate pyrophosphatase